MTLLNKRQRAVSVEQDVARHGIREPSVWNSFDSNESVNPCSLTTTFVLYMYLINFLRIHI